MMKKLPLILCLLLTGILFSCKKEINEPETVKEIESLIVQKNVSKETFKREVIPLIKDLHEADSVKYQMIEHIANKAEKETNKDIYKINVKNLEEALEYVK